MQEASKCGIYVIEQSGTGRFYIGSSAAIRQRWYQHRKLLDAGKHHAPFLQNAWTKHGPDAFAFSVLEECDRAELLAREQEYLTAFRPVFNVCEKAGSRLGVKFTPEQRLNLSGIKKALGYRFSDESKAKIAARLRGNTNSLGFRHTADAKAKISATHAGKPSPLRGVPRPPDVVAKVSAAQKGKPRPYLVGRVVSEGTRAKIAAKLRGNTNGAARRITPELREKLRAGNVGRTRSNEARANMRAARLRYLARTRGEP